MGRSSVVTRTAMEFKQIEQSCDEVPAAPAGEPEAIVRKRLWAAMLRK